MFKLNILRMTGLNIVAGFLVGKAVANVCSAICPSRLLFFVCVCVCVFVCVCVCACVCVYLDWM